MKDAGLPVTLIVLGLAGLAWHYGWFPDPDWIVTLGLVIGGIAVLVFDGVTKASVVIGPSLIALGLAWSAHERLRAPWVVLVPALLIVLGVLMLIARHPRIPERRTRTNL